MEKGNADVETFLTFLTILPKVRNIKCKFLVIFAFLLAVSIEFLLKKPI